MIIEFDLPDVRAPTEPFIGYWAKQAFIGHFSNDRFVISLAATYVRCVFAAREDYIAAAQHLREALGPTLGRQLDIGNFYRSIARFESCITAMYLAVRSLRELRKRRELQPNERAVLCENKPKPRFLGIDGELIGKMRNKMQHIEEELAKGKLTDALIIMIQPTGPEVLVKDSAQPGQSVKTIDRLRVHGHEVRFSELAGWLEEMIEYVEKLQKLMPTGVNSTTGKVFAPTLPP